MALTSTVYSFEINLADVDRGVYQDLSLRLALHPSETVDHLWTRLLAYCLEYEEGIAFAKGGVSAGDDPAVAIKDPSGRYRAWIEASVPDGARLHRAAKAAQRVAVYAARLPPVALRQLAEYGIHRAAEIPFYLFEPRLISGLAAALERRMALSISVTGRQLYIDSAGRTLEGGITELRLG